MLFVCIVKYFRRVLQTTLLGCLIKINKTWWWFSPATNSMFTHLSSYTFFLLSLPHLDSGRAIFECKPFFCFQISSNSGNFFKKCGWNISIYCSACLLKKLKFTAKTGKYLVQASALAHVWNKLLRGASHWL